jgi:hypothetical protein
MNKKVIYVGVIVIILAVLYYFGLFSFLNDTLNRLVAGEPDKTCSVDSDCIMKQIDCSRSTCDKEAVNVKWNNFCPFRKRMFEAISGCGGSINAKCIEGICISELDYTKSLRT